MKKVDTRDPAQVREMLQSYGISQADYALIRKGKALFEQLLHGKCSDEEYSRVASDFHEIRQDLFDAQDRMDAALNRKPLKRASRRTPRRPPGEPVIMRAAA